VFNLTYDYYLLKKVHSIHAFFFDFKLLSELEITTVKSNNLNTNFIMILNLKYKPIMNSIYGIFVILFCTIVTAQNVSGVSINWNVEVGCQEYTIDFSDPGKPIFIETIPDDLCIHVCERSSVTYTLSGNIGGSPATQWIVTGGIITFHNDETCTVLWGEMGEGSVGFSIATPNGINTKNLCIQKVKTPIANFNIVGTGSEFIDEDMGQLVYYACTDQFLNFVNTSTTIPGSELTSSWFFGDGSSSGDTNPSHAYTRTWFLYCLFKSNKRMRMY